MASPLVQNASQWVTDCRSSRGHRFGAMTRAGSSLLLLGALACLFWGPSFTGSAPKRPQSAVVRMAGSKWVNEQDP
eukprot:s3076_g3.t1